MKCAEINGVLYLARSPGDLADLVQGDLAEFPVEVLSNLFTGWAEELSRERRLGVWDEARRLILSGEMKPFTYLDNGSDGRQVMLFTSMGGMFPADDVRGVFKRFIHSLSFIWGFGLRDLPTDMLDLAPEVFVEFLHELPASVHEVDPQDDLIEPGYARKPKKLYFWYDVDDGRAVILSRSVGSLELVTQLIARGHRVVEGVAGKANMHRIQVLVRMLLEFPELENPFRWTFKPSSVMNPPELAAAVDVLVMVDPTWRARSEEKTA